MGEAYRLYSPAVYAVMRRRGASPEQAEELTQRFFVERVFEKGMLARAERGRCTHLRAFVRAAVKNFMIDDARARRAGPGGAVSLDGRGFAAEEGLVAGWARSSPEEVLDRRWAGLVLEEALKRCEGHYRATGKERTWRAFEERVLIPSRQGSVAPSPAEVALRHGFASAQDASAAVQTVKRALDARIREVIGETAEDVDEEWAYLRGLMA